MQILAKHKITTSCDRRPRRRDLYFALHLVFSFLSRRISVVFLSDVLSDLKLLSSQLVDVHPVTHRGHPLVVMATGLCADGCCADVIIQHSL